jgi:hypothetical protein
MSGGDRFSEKIGEMDRMGYLGEMRSKWRGGARFSDREIWFSLERRERGSEAGESVVIEWERDM